MASDPLELEHVIGYTGRQNNTLVLHPAQPNTHIFGIGAVVVIGNLDDPHDQAFLRFHDEEVSCIAVSPSGRLIASGQIGSTKRQRNDAPIIVWDFASRKIVYQLPGHLAKVNTLAFSPDDKFLVSTGADGRLCIWDMESGEMDGGNRSDKPPGFAVWGKPADFNPRRPKYTLVVGYYDQVKVNTWQYDVRAMQFVLAGEGCSVPGAGRGAGFMRTYHCALIDPANKYCLAGTATGEVVVYSIESKAYRNSVQVSSNGVLCAVIDRTGSTIFVGAGDGTIKRLAGWDRDWHTQAETRLEGKVVSLSLSSDGIELLAGTSAGKMYRILTEDLSFTEVAESHVGSVKAVAFGSSSDYFCTVSADNTVRIWNLSDYSTIATGTGPVAATCCAYLDENTVVTGWEDGFIRCFDAKKSGPPKWQIINAHRGPITTIAVTGQFICSGGVDGNVRIWSARSRELVHQHAEHIKTVSALIADTVSPNLIHSCGQSDRTVITYDLKQKKKVAYHSIRESSFTCLSQRKDSENEVVTAGPDGRLMFWDIDYADPVQVLRDPSNMRITCVAVSPSGRFIATCGDDLLVKIWELFEGGKADIIAEGTSHSATINSVQWSPDEKQLVSVGDDCSICVWNFYG